MTESLRNPKVYNEYLSFLKKDVLKYSTSGENLNYMKTAKRLYNYLKVSGDLKGAEQLSKLFNSPTSELAMRIEDIKMMADYLPNIGTGKFKIEDMIFQNKTFSDFLTKNKTNLKLTDNILNNVNEIGVLLQKTPLDNMKIQELTKSITNQLKVTVNEESLKILKSNETFLKLTNFN